MLRELLGFAYRKNMDELIYMDLLIKMVYEELSMSK
jgi:hypothetical protein